MTLSGHYLPLLNEEKRSNIGPVKTIPSGRPNTVLRYKEISGHIPRPNTVLLHKRVKIKYTMRKVTEEDTTDFKTEIHS